MWRTVDATSSLCSLQPTGVHIHWSTCRLEGSGRATSRSKAIICTWLINDRTRSAHSESSPAAEEPRSLLVSFSTWRAQHV